MLVVANVREPAGACRHLTYAVSEQGVPMRQTLSALVVFGLLSVSSAAPAAAQDQTPSVTDLKKEAELQKKAAKAKEEWAKAEEKVKKLESELQKAREAAEKARATSDQAQKERDAFRPT
jgi:hypothetical protein